MEKHSADEISVNTTRLRGLIENINKISFHQAKAKALTECVLLQYQDILDEAKHFNKNKKRSVI
jgi:hypothetical protein